MMSICITKRKDGRFMGRFIIGHSENGKPLYQYVYGQTYDEALKKVQIGMEVESRYLSGKNISVLEAYHEWINAAVNKVKESTYANYYTKFEKHILPAFSDVPCVDLNAGKINAFINKKLAEGLSASYVRDIIIVFKSMLHYAQEEHHFQISLKNVVLPKTEKKKIEKIGGDEHKKLVHYLKSHLNPTSLGILISLYMGLRIGELCGLKWSDVDFSNKVLYIRRTVQRIAAHSTGKQKTKVVITTPKSDSSLRAIAIPDFIMLLLEKLRADDDAYLLSGCEKVVEPRTYQYRYKKMLAAASVENHNYHQLRHTFATNCMENGFDIKTLSMVLGHKNVTITLNRYIHPDIIHERKLMNQMTLLF